MKKYKRKCDKCKILRAEILEMISSVDLKDLELLKAMKSVIINTQADYYYSDLVKNSYFE